jgi:hypothetical protein
MRRVWSSVGPQRTDGVAGVSSRDQASEGLSAVWADPTLDLGKEIGIYLCTTDAIEFGTPHLM